MKYIRSALIGIVLAATIIAGYQVLDSDSINTQITSFDQCAAAGNPIQESYPARCVTPDGQSFTQPINP